VGERYPDPLGEAPEEKGRPERGLRRTEERRMAVAATDLGQGGGLGE
jgi:hypothetical protein